MTDLYDKIESMKRADFAKKLFPRGKYKTDDYREVEYRALFVLSLIPKAKVERTRDVIQIEHGGHTGIVVIVTKEALEIRLPTIEWPHPHYPAESSDLLKRYTWDELDTKGRETDLDKLAGILETATKEREKQFTTCKYCGGKFPPEGRIDDDVCHSCAERHEKIIF